MNMGRIIKLFKRGSVCVTGMRGTGKDVLFGNVIARRKKGYVSNLDYGGDFTPLRLADLDCGGNTYKDFIDDNLSPFAYPYPKGDDIYVSDVGVYLPSQYCNKLNNEYPFLPTYLALSRQISRNNVHINVQNLNRAWDKLREQSDIYIKCNWCKVIFGLVFQSVTLYDKYESCLARLEPCRVRVPLLGDKVAKMQARIALDSFYNQHGKVEKLLLVYVNKSSHDTYLFEKKMGVTYPNVP